METIEKRLQVLESARVQCRSVTVLFFKGCGAEDSAEFERSLVAAIATGDRVIVADDAQLFPARPGIEVLPTAKAYQAMCGAGIPLRPESIDARVIPADTAEAVYRQVMF